MSIVPPPLQSTPVPPPLSPHPSSSSVSFETAVVPSKPQPQSPLKTPPRPVDPTVTRPLQLYVRQKEHKTNLKQAQELEPMLKKEIIQEKDTTQVNSPTPMFKKRELDLPIAVRKGTRCCTQHPLSHFVSFEKISSSHKAFLNHLNSIAIPKTLSEALSSKE